MVGWDSMLLIVISCDCFFVHEGVKDGGFV